MGVTTQYRDYANYEVRVATIFSGETMMIVDRAILPVSQIFLWRGCSAQDERRSDGGEVAGASRIAASFWHGISDKV